MPFKFNILNHDAANQSVATLHDLLAEELLACLVMSIVERLDLAPLEEHKDSTLQQAASPATLLALLFYAYTSGEYSSRNLAQAARHDKAYRLITAGIHVNHNIISRFRNRFRNELESLFVAIMEIFGSYGLVKQKNTGLDMQTAREHLHREVALLFDRAEQADMDVSFFQEAPHHESTPHNSASRRESLGVNDIGGVPPPASQPNGIRLSQDQIQQAIPAAGKTAELKLASTGRHNSPSVGKPKAEKNYSHNHSNTYTFLSRNDAVHSLASGMTNKIAPPWKTALRSCTIPTLPVDRLFRSIRQQARLGNNMGTALLILIPVLAITLVLTYNIPRNVLIGGDSETDTSQLPAPVLEITTRETGNVTSTLVQAPPDNPSLPEPYREKKPVSVEKSTVVSGSADLNRAAPIHSEPALAASGKSSIQAANPVETTASVAGDGSREAATAPPRDQGQGTSIHRENWLLEQPADHYMLQLAGSRYEAPLRKMIVKHHPGDPVAYYKGLHKGGDWYILLYGIFSTRQAALDTINSLPEKFHRNRPWPRKLSSIQAAILEQH